MSHKREWFDDEKFWRDLYGYMFSEARFAEPRKQLTGLLKLARPRGKTVLDLCCGPGRWAIPIAARGFSVTAVDRSRYLLTKARAKAKAAKVGIEWVQIDMRDFARPRAFDLVLSMFTSFGYFENRQEDRLVLRNIFSSLRPGGVLVMDFAGKEWLAKVFQTTVSERLPDGALLVQRHEVIDAWTRLRNEWILIRNGRAKTFKFDLSVYSAQELRDRLEDAGFGEISMFGSLSGEAYGTDSRRLVAVARKPASVRGGLP